MNLITKIINCDNPIIIREGMTAEELTREIIKVATNQAIETKQEYDYIGKKVELNNHPIFQNGMKATIKKWCGRNDYVLELIDFPETIFNATTEQFKTIDEEFELKGKTAEGYEDNFGDYYMTFGDNEAQVTLEENSLNSKEVTVNYTSDEFKILTKGYKDDKELVVNSVLEEAKLIDLRKQKTLIEDQLNIIDQKIAKVDNSFEKKIYEKYGDKINK